MSERPVVSVVVPTRNRVHYLTETVASVQGQTFDDWELIVIDDASTDGTWDWLQQHPDARVRSFRMPQASERSLARNRGLAEARGRYVLFLDSDDLLVRRALERLVRALDAHPEAGAAFGSFVEFDTSGSRRRGVHPHRSGSRWAWTDALFYWKANPGRNLFRTELIRQIGGFDPYGRIKVGWEDFDLWLHVVRRAPIVFVPDVVLEIRLHDSQTLLADGRRFVEDISSQHVAEASSDQRVAAERILAARAAYVAGMDALADQAPMDALKHFVEAVRAEPGVLRSPIVRPRFVRAFAKSVAGLATGSAGLGATRRVMGLARRAPRRYARKNR